MDRERQHRRGGHPGSYFYALYSDYESLQGPGIPILLLNPHATYPSFPGSQCIREKKGAFSNFFSSVMVRKGGREEHTNTEPHRDLGEHKARAVVHSLSLHTLVFLASSSLFLSYCKSCISTSLWACSWHSSRRNFTSFPRRSGRSTIEICVAPPPPPRRKTDKGRVVRDENDAHTPLKHWCTQLFRGRAQM